MPFQFPMPSSRAAYTILALLPVALPTAYLLIWKASVSRHVTTEFGKRSPGSASSSRSQSLEGSALQRPSSLPTEVASAESDYVLTHERVVSRHPIRPSTLSYPISSAELLTTYMRTTMEAFSWTPQAFAIRASIKDASDKHTFDKDWIQSLDFKEGDRVNGGYVVVYRGEHGTGGNKRVELMLSPPESYHGPVVNGLIVSAVEMAGDDQFVFANEVWLWRKQDEKPVFLESAVGRWMHSLMVGWLIVKGAKAVTRSQKGGKGKSA